MSTLYKYLALKRRPGVKTLFSYSFIYIVMQLCIAFHRHADSCPGYIIELLQTCKTILFLSERRSLGGLTCDFYPMLEHLGALLTQVRKKEIKEKANKSNKLVLNAFCHLGSCVYISFIDKLAWWFPV